MRLIDADKLIHALANEFIDGKKTLGQVIDEQPTVYADKWIPVSERLLEKHKTVITTTRYDGFMGMYGTWLKTAFIDDNCEWNGECIGGTVLAWMPLPEPYKINMGYCKIECPDGEIECCICCNKQNSCNAKCAEMDMYKYAEDCGEYVVEDDYEVQKETGSN